MYTNSEINKNSYFYSVSKILCFGVIFLEFYNTVQFFFDSQLPFNFLTVVQFLLALSSALSFLSTEPILDVKPTSHWPDGLVTTRPRLCFNTFKDGLKDENGDIHELLLDMSNKFFSSYSYKIIYIRHIQ